MGDMGFGGDFAVMRRAMVDSQLRTSDVTDPDVVRALATVPREQFVPESRRATAYIDRAIPLSEGRALNPPLALGRMLVALAPRRDDRALVVGAGTGYAAAVLAELAGHVTALEQDEDLIGLARAALQGDGRITLIAGPLAAGAPDAGPFDIILVDGAVEELPAALTAQLAEGGRLATALGERGVTRIALGRKQGGAFGLTTLADSEAAVLPGFERPRGFSF